LAAKQQDSTGVCVCVCMWLYGAPRCDSIHSSLFSIHSSVMS